MCDACKLHILKKHTTSPQVMFFTRDCNKPTRPDSLTPTGCVSDVDCCTVISAWDRGRQTSSYTFRFASGAQLDY